MKPNPPINLLLVDDHPANLVALEAILDGLGLNLVKATSGEQALRALMEREFALVLTDVTMPGLGGFDLAALIRQREQTRSTPIIFLTATEPDPVKVVRAYGLGAVDYLVKPLVPEILRAKVQVFVRLYQQARAIREHSAGLAAANERLSAEMARRQGVEAALQHALADLETQVQARTAALTRESERVQELLARAEKGRRALLSALGDQRRAQTASRESEERLRLVLDGLGPHVFVGLMDVQGMVLLANRSALEAAGLQQADVQGQPVADTYWWSYSVEVQTRLRHAVERAARGEPVRYDEQIRAAEGQLIWLDFSIQPLRDETGGVRFLIPSGRVITEHKQAEEQVRRLNMDLERHAAELEQRVAERTAELAVARDRAEAADRIKSAFLANMSHELRTPLNSVIGFTGILLQGLVGPLNAEQTKQLRMVKESGQHLLALINDVLDISKIEAGQIEIAEAPFDLPASLQKVVQTVVPLAGQKHLALGVRVAPEVGQITSDRRRVEQILLNLLTNAIKFTEKGEVVVEVMREDVMREDVMREDVMREGVRSEGVMREDVMREAHGLRITDYGSRIMDHVSGPTDHASRLTPHSSHVLRISITDTGMGIKPEDVDKLFQPFRQLDSGLTRQHEGTGLGLAICKRLVEKLGGQIGVRSEPGQGSTFWFTLPRGGSD